MVVMIGVSWLLFPSPVQARLVATDVNRAFREVFGRPPNAAESKYWLNRTYPGDKDTYRKLVGAMLHARSHGKTKAGTPRLSTAQLEKRVEPTFKEIFGRKPRHAEKVYWVQRVRCKSIKTLKGLRISMRFAKSRKSTTGRKIDFCAKTTARAAPGVEPGINRNLGIGGHVAGDPIRVAITSVPFSRAVVITSNGKFQLRNGRTQKIRTFGAGTKVSVRYRGEKYLVAAGEWQRELSGPVYFIPLHQAIMEVLSYSDPSATFAGKNYRRFRGFIKVQAVRGRLWVINELRTRYYLRGLAETVRSEADDAPAEYYKALGIVARTYALYWKSQGGRVLGGTADVTNSPAADQWYRGYEAEIIHPRLNRWFDSVRGIVVTYGGKLVVTPYFSRSDGKTRSSKKWPHLRSVPDPHGGKELRGHGLGMSALGAYNFAKRGKSFAWIIKYYYKGVKLERAY
jgi:hypothetical protein